MTLHKITQFYREWFSVCPNIDATLHNNVTSTIQKWQTFKLLSFMENLHQSTWDHDILYSANIQRINNFIFLF
jgi:hypothetical protein